MSIFQSNWSTDDSNDSMYCESHFDLVQKLNLEGEENKKRMTLQPDSELNMLICDVIDKY